MDEYSKLILEKIMSGYEFDYADIALKLATTNPMMFCELAGLISDDNIKYYSIIDSYIKSGQMIVAIKELHAFTGWGLKESKDYCDARKEKLGIPRNSY